MKILALETAADPGSVALWLDGRVVARDCPRELSNSAALLPAAEAALKAEGLGFSDLDGIAFGMGPGSFTGLRVACGVAQGLAVGRGLALLGVGTLEAMALAAGGGRVMVTLDARMGEVYHGAFVDGVLQGEIGVCPPERVSLPGLPGSSGPSGWLACGSGLLAYPALRERLAGVVTDWKADIRPHAEFVARLAAPRIERGERVDPADAAPLYVRDKVAKTVAERLAEGGRA
ncbi:MAG: tRNA (adenosine(37)-N6)-threonylcarbamoyltransferase complex dimerization subunit type 1 TsaB [Candidatus Accumulibacter sp.]|jgi:tRNA threonylcarbamoyladenosine biosynthesis protein TsaB|nr:tRNA (adenosine(37)-N6)-threonylcarbamoyltransferase complex dimerization subunit type 1 TsaB [Accumulibacter sp.]